MKRTAILVCATIATLGFLGEAAPASAQDSVLVVCAKEGKTCIAPNADTPITYGLDGAVKTIKGVTEIGCSNDAFKGDPLRGKDKICTYVINPNSFTWTQCAKEGDKCDFTGAKLVRYGAGGQWTYRSFVNGTDCNNGTFGDPARGNDKTCQVAN